MLAKWWGDNYTKSQMKAWWAGRWSDKLELRFLSNSFFIVVCESPDQKREMLLERDLEMDGHGFFLIGWTKHFDATQYALGKMQVWGDLENLPAELWSEEALEVIRNALGRFVAMDKAATKDENEGKMRILEEIAPWNQVLEELELTHGGVWWMQKVDWRWINCQTVVRRIWERNGLHHEVATS